MSNRPHGEWKAEDIQIVFGGEVHEVPLKGEARTAQEEGAKEDWWTSMSKDQQEAYLKEHPKSEKAKTEKTDSSEHKQIFTDKPSESSPRTAKVPPQAKEVCGKLKESGYQSFLVGGSVRDILMGGRDPHDWDITTNATPDQVTKLFDKVVPTGIDFGTVTVMKDGIGYEVTTYRAEGRYEDGRRPESVEYADKIDDDLSRRDFTMNAIGMDADSGELADPFGGAKDIEEKVIRTVGDPKERFSEDGLRVMRAARFAATLGFSVDPETLAAMKDPEVHETLKKVSPERMRDEMLKGLASDHPSTMLNLWAKAGILPIVAPPLEDLSHEDWESLTQAVDRLPQDLCVAAIAASVPKDAEDLLYRLKLPKKDITRAVRIAEAQDKARELPPNADMKVLRRFSADVGRGTAIQAIQVGAALGNASETNVERVREIVEDTLLPLSTKDLALDGKQIAEILGVKPGKEVGEAMRKLLDRVIDDPDSNSEAGLKGYLESFSKKADWFSGLSHAEQLSYLKEHPSSKKSPDGGEPEETPQKAPKTPTPGQAFEKSIEDMGEAMSNLPENTKRLFTDKAYRAEVGRGIAGWLRKKGQAFVGSLAKEIREIKDSGKALGKLARHQALDEHDKHALKTIGKQIATTLAGTVVIGGLGHLTAAAVATHWVGEALLKATGRAVFLAQIGATVDPYETFVRGVLEDVARQAEQFGELDPQVLMKTAAEDDNWWSGLSHEQQLSYIKEHPRTKKKPTGGPDPRDEEGYQAPEHKKRTKTEELEPGAVERAESPEREKRQVFLSETRGLERYIQQQRAVYRDTERTEDQQEAARSEAQEAKKELLKYIADYVGYTGDTDGWAYGEEVDKVEKEEARVTYQEDVKSRAPADLKTTVVGRHVLNRMREDYIKRHQYEEKLKKHKEAVQVLKDHKARLERAQRGEYEPPAWVGGIEGLQTDVKYWEENLERNPKPEKPWPEVSIKAYETLMSKIAKCKTMDGLRALASLVQHDDAAPRGALIDLVGISPGDTPSMPDRLYEELNLAREMNLRDVSGREPKCKTIDDLQKTFGLKGVEIPRNVPEGVKQHIIATVSNGLEDMGEALGMDFWGGGNKDSAVGLRFQTIEDLKEGGGYDAGFSVGGYYSSSNRTLTLAPTHMDAIAHELGHAFDNLLSEKERFTTHDLAGHARTRQEDRPKHPKGLPRSMNPEDIEASLKWVEKAVTDYPDADWPKRDVAVLGFLKAVTSSPAYERFVDRDTRVSEKGELPVAGQAYDSNPAEVMARFTEQYVFTVLAEKGKMNPFLTDVGYLTYPAKYWKKEEFEEIRPAFEKILDHMKKSGIMKKAMAQFLANLL